MSSNVDASAMNKIIPFTDHPFRLINVPMHSVLNMVVRLEIMFYECRCRSNTFLYQSSRKVRKYYNTTTWQQIGEVQNSA